MAKYCSPNNRDRENQLNFSCFDHNELIVIAEAFNKYIKTNKNNICKKSRDNKVCITNKKINIDNKSEHELWKSLHRRFNKIAKNEYEWLDFDFINLIKDKSLKQNIQHFTFKPKSPKHKYSWLNTQNIDEIMGQYQDLYKKDFKFLGAQPSDISSIFKFNWNKLKTKTRYLGIVFNKDTHKQPGSHWIAIFFDNKYKTVEYFDSLGELPNKYIKDFLKYFIEYDFIYNKIEHQKANSNCGIYSINFILQRLSGRAFNDINSRIIKDKMMTDLRSILFRPN